MATEGGSRRVIMIVEGVSIKLTSPDDSLGGHCSVELTNNQLDLVSGDRRMSLQFSVIKSIDLHQPIFGANYIIGEFNDGDRMRSFTLTFNNGGATEFTRLFFRLAAGELVNTQHDTTQTHSASEDKKNI